MEDSKGKGKLMEGMGKCGKVKEREIYRKSRDGVVKNIEGKVEVI